MSIVDPEPQLIDPMGYNQFDGTVWNLIYTDGNVYLGYVDWRDEAIFGYSALFWYIHLKLSPDLTTYESMPGVGETTYVVPNSKGAIVREFGPNGLPVKFNCEYVYTYYKEKTWYGDETLATYSSVIFNIMEDGTVNWLEAIEA